MNLICKWHNTPTGRIPVLFYEDGTMVGGQVRTEVIAEADQLTKIIVTFYNDHDRRQNGVVIEGE